MEKAQWEIFSLGIHFTSFWTIHSYISSHSRISFYFKLLVSLRVVQFISIQENSGKITTLTYIQSTIYSYNFTGDKVSCFASSIYPFERILFTVWCSLRARIVSPNPLSLIPDNVISWLLSIKNCASSVKRFRAWSHFTTTTHFLSLSNDGYIYFYIMDTAVMENPKEYAQRGSYDLIAI